MYKAMIAKWFCLHKWQTHAKHYNYRTEETVEIIICQNCGKIKTLEY